MKKQTGNSQEKDKTTKLLQLATIPFIFVAFFILSITSTPEGAIKRSMFAEGYSLQQLMQPMELSLEERYKAGFIYEIYTVALKNATGETEISEWKVEYWPKSCNAARIEELPGNEK